MPIYQKSLGGLVSERGIAPINEANFPAALMVYDYEDVPTSGALLSDRTTSLVNGYIMGTGTGTRNATTGIVANGSAMTNDLTQVALSATAVAGQTVVGFGIGATGALVANGPMFLGANPTTDVAGVRINNTGGANAINDAAGEAIVSANMVAGDGSTIQMTVGIFEIGARMRGFRYLESGLTVLADVSLAGEGDVALANSWSVGASFNPGFTGWLIFDNAPSRNVLLEAFAWTFHKFMDDKVKALHPILMDYE